MFLFLIIALTAHCWWKLRRDFEAGVCLSVFYLSWLPHGLKLQVNSLPDITIHRTILLVLFLSVFARRFIEPLKFAGIPLVKTLQLLVLLHLVSLLFGITFELGLKRFVLEIAEEILFYCVIYSYSSTPERRAKLLTSILFGVAIAGVIAVIERFSVNMVFVLVPDLTIPADRGASIATYENRIHLGYAMALALPIALMRFVDATSTWRRAGYFFCIGTLGAALYFGQSRGPWLGGMFGGLMLLIFLSPSLRMRLLKAFLLLAFLSLFYPGVRESIVDSLSTIAMPDTEQGASAEYRKILWHVAYTELCKSPITFLVGYGPMATGVVDIQSYFGRNRGGLAYLQTGGSSWDSEYAANLFQYGFLGFFVFLAIPFEIAVRFAKARRQQFVEYSALAPAAACFIVYQWAMTNVAIFSPQLKYVYWTCIAAGLRICVDNLNTFRINGVRPQIVDSDNGPLVALNETETHL